MKGITVFETLTDIREDYIRDAELDACFLTASIHKKERDPSAFSRFMNSGWGVAIVCALVAVSVMGGIIWAGQQPGNTPPATESGQDSQNIILPTTDTSLESDTEEITLSERTEGLIFKSNGDGTCYLQSIGGCMDEVIVIPEVSPDGDTVTAIGTNAFVLPDSQGGGSIRYNTYVKRVELPGTITEIKASAFENCHALESINLPEGLLTIEEKAFQGCHALNHIQLPQGLTAMGENAFYSCFALESITVPASVTDLSDDAFYDCRALKEVILEEGLTRIGSMAFANCKSLSYIKLPSTIQDIGSSAFFFCENLETIELAKGITQITSYAFGYCSGLKNIVFPDSLTFIGSEAFYQCTSLEEITIPSTVKKIHSRAFYQCTALTSVTLLCENDALNGRGIFQECMALSEISFPEGYTILPQSTLSGCLSLKRVTLPSTIRHIDKYFLQDCTALEEIIYNGTSEEWKQSAQKAGKWNENTPNYVIRCTDGTLKKNGSEWSEENSAGSYIEPGASVGLYFKSNGDGTCYVAGMGICTDTRVVIPSVSPAGDRVVSIGLQAFDQQTKLKEVVIPEGVTSIKESALAYCISMEKITIPSTVLEIGAYAFIGCERLKEMDFGDSLETIQEMAFHLCDGLMTIHIPKTLKAIESRALSLCMSLKTIYYEGTMAEWEEVFKDQDWDEYMGGGEGYTGSSGTYTTTVICTDGEIIIP